MKTKIATLAMLTGSVLPGWGYTVTLNIDNPQAVNVYSDDVAVAVINGDNEVSAEQLILVTVNDGFAFTRADDLDTGLSYLNYDRQKTPIYIRSGIYDGEQVNEVDGHTIVIETLDESTLQTYSMEVNVDDASKVIFKVGPTSEFYSSQNTEIALHDGTNTVTYTEGERYIHITATTFLTEFYSVQVNGKEMKQYGYIYSWPIPTGDVRVDIVVKYPNASETPDDPIVPEDRDTERFVLSIDDLSKVSYVTNETQQKELLDILQDGENIVRYAPGDEFTIWPRYGETPLEVTLDGVVVEPRGNLYWFAPQNLSKVIVRFNEGTSVSTLTGCQPQEIIYNLYGLKVGTRGDLHTLPAGIYIIDGKKVTKK